MGLRPDPQALLRNAISTAERGWPVFLLGRTKRPLPNCQPCRAADTDHNRDTCPCLTCHGFYAATVDPQRIHAMCAAYPRGLLAIRTGDASGLVVIDIDPAHGGRVALIGLMAARLIPRTACVVTGSGGWHLYYTHPGTIVLNSQSLLGDGIDVRGDGGYVVAPPSIHPRTKLPYRWADTRRPVEMPPPLVDRCQGRPAPTVTATSTPTPTYRGGGISSPAALLAAHLRAVETAPQGRRRVSLYGAARGVARMVAAGALSTPDAYNALTHAGRSAGQTDRDIRAAIVGGFRAEHVATEGLAA